MKNYRRTPFVIFFIFSSFLALSLINKTDSEDHGIKRIVKQINRFREQSMPQKVYLQTDKDIYLTGETMWIKAYLIDAMSFQADPVSKEIYVELLDQSQRVAFSLKLSNKKGVSDGYFLLNDTLIGGNYQLRAFTSWMFNFDPDYFFFKTIKITNPGYANVVNRSRLKYITKFNADMRKKESDVRFTFFPEGGNVVVGLSSRVAFKAEDESGRPLNITGKLSDNLGNEVVSFESEHDGMGSFLFLPKSEKKYSAKIKFPDGTVEEYYLPVALPHGIIMSVNPIGKEDIKVGIRQSENNSVDSIIVVTQSRGQITSISKVKIKSNQVQLVIPKKIFPAGIAQITVFNSKEEPLCERLVFINPEPEKNISKVELFSNTVNDSILYNIKVTQSTGGGVSGKLSISVIENLSDTESLTKENILTNLLLTSDIKGRVNNPSYYFDTSIPKASNYLDLVMLTNGWRRFVWKDLMEDKFSIINYPKAGGISIAGTVFGDNINQTIPNTIVELSVLNRPYFNYKTATDNNGKFYFPALGNEDEVIVKLEAVKPSDNKAGYITLSQIPGPHNITNPYPLLYNENYDKNILKENTKQENLEKKQQPKINSDEEQANQNRSYYNPSFVLKVGENASNYTNMIEFIRGRIPGLSVIGDQIIMRGTKSVNSSNEPLFLFNGSQVDLATVINLTIFDIDRVELVNGSDATAFGSRGANGVLLFYSKNSKIPKVTSIEYKVTGYQKTKEFYIPPYKSWTYKPEHFNIPKTIFWKPNLVLSPNGEVKVGFKKEFGTDKFILTLEGLTDSGEIIYKDATN